MIVEERIYTITVGSLAEYVKNYQELGYEVQTRILGNLIGWYWTEAGPLNQIIHMWGYESFEDRMERRRKLFQDETWLKYLAANRPFIISQETKILIPAPFSPVR
ncbi:MAG: NIPSNAP family protein [Alphaproteobacteria bacterium]|nr:NIPSNAP family protein [Alphaproteobacteria bacterium]